MGDVVPIGSDPGHVETVEAFIAREKVVRTENVAMRFGWDMVDARKRLHRLAREGRIIKLGRRWNEFGATLEWGPVA